MLQLRLCFITDCLRDQIYYSLVVWFVNLFDRCSKERWKWNILGCAGTRRSREGDSRAPDCSLSPLFQGKTKNLMEWCFVQWSSLLKDWQNKEKTESTVVDWILVCLSQGKLGARSSEFCVSIHYRILNNVLLNSYCYNFPNFYSFCFICIFKLEMWLRWTKSL